MHQLSEKLSDSSTSIKKAMSIAELGFPQLQFSGPHGFHVATEAWNDGSLYIGQFSNKKHNIAYSLFNVTLVNLL